MKYLVTLVQLIISVVGATLLMYFVTIYVADLSSLVYVIGHLTIIYFLMKLTAEIARKVGLPVVNIKNM